MNAVAARLNMSVGPRKTAAVAHRLGIQSELRADASLALGTSEVTLLELTGAYGVVRQRRQARSSRTSSSACAPVRAGALRAAAGGAPRSWWRRRTSARINDMLNAALVSGTGTRAALPRHPAAGKTGTSQDFRDAWFVGYTAHFVAGVWVGNDDGRSMNRVMGGNLPARLWREVMVLAHEGRTPARAARHDPDSAARQAPPSQPPPERSGDRPILPLERIEPEFVERVLGKDEMAPAAAATRRQDAPPARSTWMDRTAETLRRWIGG